MQQRINSSILLTRNIFKLASVNRSGCFENGLGCFQIALKKFREKKKWKIVFFRRCKTTIELIVTTEFTGKYVFMLPGVLLKEEWFISCHMRKQTWFWVRLITNMFCSLYWTYVNEKGDALAGYSFGTLQLSLLVLYSALRDFSTCTMVFSSHQKPLFY